MNTLNHYRLEAKSLKRACKLLRKQYRLLRELHDEGILSLTVHTPTRHLSLPWNSVPVSLFEWIDELAKTRKKVKGELLLSLNAIQELKTLSEQERGSK